MLQHTDTQTWRLARLQTFMRIKFYSCSDAVCKRKIKCFKYQAENLFLEMRLKIIMRFVLRMFDFSFFSKRFLCTYAETTILKV